jgi:hypothetical protein
MAECQMQTVAGVRELSLGAAAAVATDLHLLIA